MRSPVRLYGGTSYAALRFPSSCCISDLQVVALVGIAGTTETGNVDPLEQLANLAEEFGTSFHVDAAWGGALLLSEKYRDYLDGIELVDSVTLDFHKQFFQTISCGAAGATVYLKITSMAQQHEQ